VRTQKTTRIERPRRQIGGARISRFPVLPGKSPLRTRASAGVIEAPRETEEVLTSVGPGWIVTVYDNEYNTYEDVMAVLMIGTGCTAEEAYIEAWEIDHLGKSVVHQSTEMECRMAAKIIGKIGIQVSVTQQ